VLPDSVVLTKCRQLSMHRLCGPGSSAFTDAVPAATACCVNPLVILQPTRDLSGSHQACHAWIKTASKQANMQVDIACYP
jgi:hypothetical protein